MALKQQVEKAIRPFPIFYRRILKILVDYPEGLRKSEAQSSGDFAEPCLRFVADRQIT